MDIFVENSLLIWYSYWLLESVRSGIKKKKNKINIIICRKSCANQTEMASERRCHITIVWISKLIDIPINNGIRFKRNEKYNEEIYFVQFAIDLIRLMKVQLKICDPYQRIFITLAYRTRANAVLMNQDESQPMTDSIFHSHFVSSFALEWIIRIFSKGLRENACTQTGTNQSDL